MNNALLTRLEALIGSVNFWPDYTNVLDSPGRVLAIGEHNLHEYSKIEAMGEEYQERIHSLMCNIMAAVLQTQALERYGSADVTSIRRYLIDWQNQPENKAFIDKLMRLTNEGVVKNCVTNEEREVASEYVNALPLYMIEVIVKETSRFHYLPCAGSQSIALALADILREAAV